MRALSSPFELEEGREPMSAPVDEPETIWSQAMEAANAGNKKRAAQLFAQAIQARPRQFCGVGPNSWRPAQPHQVTAWLEGMALAGFGELAAAMQNPPDPSEFSTIMDIMNADRRLERLLDKLCENPADTPNPQSPPVRSDDAQTEPRESSEAATVPSPQTNDARLAVSRPLADAPSASTPLRSGLGAKQRQAKRSHRLLIAGILWSGSLVALAWLSWPPPSFSPTIEQECRLLESRQPRQAGPQVPFGMPSTYDMCIGLPGFVQTEGPGIQDVAQKMYAEHRQYYWLWIVAKALMLGIFALLIATALGHSRAQSDPRSRAQP